MLDWYFKSNLSARLLIGLLAGAVVGIALGYSSPDTIKAFADNTRFFGDLFVHLLKMIAIPVILFSLIAGAANIAPSRLGRVSVKIVAYYIFTSALAVAVGLAFADIFQPGAGMNIVGNEAIKGEWAESPTLSSFFLGLVPTNPAEALAKGDILPIIVFAMLFGLAIPYVRNAKDPLLVKGAEVLLQMTNSAAEAMHKIVDGIMQYAPIGGFFLIATVFAQQGAMALGSLLLVTMTVYVGLVFHLVVTYGGFLAVYRLGFFKFLMGANEAMIAAFVTRSSNGALPVSLRVSEEKLGIPRTICSFTLPLGATINMDGTAIYLGVCAMFIGNATGHPLTMDQQLIVIITATLASIGTAGLPGAGAIMLLIVLESVGLKVETSSAVAAAYAMILGIDALLDMGRTCLNVTGDIAGSVIVAKTENELNLELWKQVSTEHETKVSKSEAVVFKP